MTSRMNQPIQRQPLKHLSHYFLNVLNGSKHKQALLIYMLIAAGHFSEHLVQIVQYGVLDWSARASGGILGLWFPGLAASEVLHSSYNSFQLTGLILLAYGFRNAGSARNWWTIALVAQSWHWLEHAVLQVQYLTGHYLYNAVKQTSILEIFFPRIELHFVYNLIVFVPTVIALLLYFRQSSSTQKAFTNKESKSANHSPLELSDAVLRDVEQWLEKDTTQLTLTEKLERLNKPKPSPQAFKQKISKKQDAVLRLAAFAHNKQLFQPVEREFLSKASTHFQQSGKLNRLQKAYINRLYKHAKASGFDS